MNLTNRMLKESSQTKEYIQCDSFYMRFKTDKNYSMMIKIRTVVTFGEDKQRERTGGLCGAVTFPVLVWVIKTH